MLEFDLVYLPLLIELSSRRWGQGVVVEKTYLVKGRGIWSYYGVTRYGHSGWGTLFDDQDAFLDTYVYWKPVGPVQKYTKSCD